MVALCLGFVCVWERDEEGKRRREGRGVSSAVHQEAKERKEKEVEEKVACMNVKRREGEKREEKERERERERVGDVCG
jgi:hypothetical protein